jgi:hypothetical protein
LEATCSSTGIWSHFCHHIDAGDYATANDYSSTYPVVVGKPEQEMNTKPSLEKQSEIEAAVFRRLLSHLDSNKDVQNIELMNLAGFCRNCLAKWYVSAAQELGEPLDYDAARTVIYGMPYNEWKEKYQKEATPEQQAAFDNPEKKR